MDLGILDYYRQVILRSSDANKSSLYFSTPPCRRLVSISARFSLRLSLVGTSA
jgi:hypothetical protein